MKLLFFVFRRLLLNFVGVAILVTGLIKCFALASPEIRDNFGLGGLCTIAVNLWVWLDAWMPPVWWFLRLISPYPLLGEPLSFLLSVGGWVGLSYGLIWLGGGLPPKRASQEFAILCVNVVNTIQTYESADKGW